jgi:hypothetical protein
MATCRETSGPMQNRFDFYEVVRIESRKPRYQEIYGQEGVILGMSQAQDLSWGYAVQLLDSEDGWAIPEEELTSAGRSMKREDIYPGDSIRVKVDPNTGEGSVG